MICQKCGKFIGAFTQPLVFYEAAKMITYSPEKREYVFLCDECKPSVETNITMCTLHYNRSYDECKSSMETKGKQYTFKDMDAITDIIKGLNYIKPDDDEMEAMKNISYMNIRNEPMSVVFEMYKNKLMKIKQNK